MKKAVRMRCRLLARVIALVLGVGIFAGGFGIASFVSHAESQAKVTSPKGANIRKEASASSQAVGGAENGKVLTVISQVQGADGYTWYQVKNGDITGYIRSDLVELSEGEVPAEGGEGGGAAPVDVMAVNPISAAVSSESGKIRDSASSEGQILAEVPIETILTVNGQATDADGRTWYQVSCIAGETQVEGFIRYDYVTLSGELTPLTGGEPAAPEEPAETPVEPAAEPKLYDTLIQDGEWLLVDYSGAEPKGYSVSELFAAVTNNGELYAESEKTVKNQKIIIIILVLLLVAAAAGIAFLVYKVKDMMDSAYFSEAEKAVDRRKTASADRNGSRNARVPEQERSSARPAGARSSGYGQRPSGYGQGERGITQGERGSSQGQRPVGSSQVRSAGGSQGQRPAGGSQGQRPAGASQGERGIAQGQRSAGAPQEQRPVRPAQDSRQSGAPQGAVGSSQGQRPTGAQQGARRPAGATQGQRPAEPSQSQRGGGAPKSGRSVRQASSQDEAQKAQPKNFMAEDDDGFLNYDE